MTDPRCSIVIPVHDRADLTWGCLQALTTQDLGGAEVIVVDDGSMDATPRLLEHEAAWVRTITHPTAQGFAAACNAGFAAARGREVVFLNNDTIPQPGWLAALQAEADAHPEAGAIGARLLYPDGTVQHAGVGFGSGGWPNHIYRGLPGDHPAASRSRELQAVTAACVLFRSPVFAELGGFDLAFANGLEDIDLCLRLRRAGHRVRYCGAAVVTHLESPTRGVQDDTANRELFLSRWPDVSRDEGRIYLEDGLLEVDRGQDVVVVRVAPLLGAPEVADAGDGALERLLLDEAIQRRRLQWRLTELTASLGPAPPLRFAFTGDGAVTPLKTPLDHRAALHAAPTLADVLADRVRPLVLDVDPGAPERVELLVGALDPRALEGEGLVLLQLACALRGAGRRVRIVCLDAPAPSRDELALLRGHDGLGALADLELAGREDAGGVLTVAPGDRWLSASWGAAHVAAAASAELGRHGFVGLWQDDEVAALPQGAFAALAAEGRRATPRAIVTAELLAASLPGDALAAPAVVVVPPLADPGPVTAAGLVGPSDGRRVLVHATPSVVRARVGFELSLLALRAAVEAGTFTRAWRFTGVGLSGDAVDLGDGHRLEPLPRQRAVGYRALLRGHEVGLAPLLSAHPGRLALELAAAGGSVVTTSWGPKTAAAMEALSGNVRAAAPTPAALVAGLAWAVGRVKDTDARTAGAAVRAPRTAADAYGPDLLAAVLALLDAPRG